MKLETKRLILRDWVSTDPQDLIEGLNNLAVARWLAFIPHPYTEQHAREWITLCIEKASKGDPRGSFEFAIELISEHKVIGGVGLDRISNVHGTAGGGIWLNERYQGRGYGAEAFGEKIRFAFEVLELRRLDNGFFAGNIASLKMQETFGYKIEGMRRKAFRCMADGEIKDEFITGLLKEEWVRC